MQTTPKATAVVEAVILRRDQFTSIFDAQPEGTRLMGYIADSLRDLSNEYLFALYTEFGAPSVSHELMEEWDFSEYHNPISLMRFAIGLQIADLVNTFSPDPEHTSAFTETISYLHQNLEDLAGYVNLQLDKGGLRADERVLLGDVIEHLNDAHWNIDPENLEVEK